MAEAFLQRSYADNQHAEAAAVLLDKSVHLLKWDE